MRTLSGELSDAENAAAATRRPRLNCAEQDLLHQLQAFKHRHRNAVGHMRELQRELQRKTAAADQRMRDATRQATALAEEVASLRDQLRQRSMVTLHDAFETCVVV